MEKNFKISVIMPIYNVGEYLRDSIDSIVGQTIGFEKNIQLILINDGSLDNSEEICLDYRDRFPDNIVYVFQKNSGVSAARNKGMEYIRGDLVNFMDPDDKWDEEAFCKFYNFFNTYSNADVCTAFVMYFDGRTGEYPLNYRNKDGERLADINNVKEYDSIVMQVTSAFFRTKSIRDVKFKEDLLYSEDTLFINTIVLKKLLVGILPGAIYFYRRRYDNTSAVQQSKKDPKYFLSVVDDTLYKLLNLSLLMYNKVIPYIQNVIYYDLGWRLRADVDSVLNSEQKALFFEKAHILLKEVDDSVILHSKIHINFVYKDLAWQLKYGHSLSEDIKIAKGGVLRANKKKVMNMSSNNSCKINFVEIENGCLKVEGVISKWLFNCKRLDPYFVLIVGKHRFQPILSDNVNTFVNTINGRVYYQFRFLFYLPLEKLDKGGEKIQLGFIFNNKIHSICLNYGKFIPNWNSSPWIRKSFNGGYVCSFQREFIEIWRPRHPFLSMVRYEFNHQKWMRRNGLRKIANFRIRYMVHKFFHRSKKEIWLVSDRIIYADDNGEVFFKYLNSLNMSDVCPVYVISKEAECVPDLKAIGDVVYFESRKYKMMFLDATKIISSNADETGYNPLNPFGENRQHLQDFFHQKYYFLQHGVTEKDQSSWLRRDNKNIEILYTSSSRERESIINAPYGYMEKNVALTGLARFDRLEDHQEKNILIVPTWRRSIWVESGEETEKSYYGKFRETEFFQFYNALINHPKLLGKMREKGYTGTFALHPRFAAQWVNFKSNCVFTVNEGHLNYSEAFSKASLVLTDFSSSVFDVAYLRKYIIYAQFDKDIFYEGQVYDEGYFNYEKDGFGPICYDLESTVNALIEALDLDCKVPDEYLDRMNSFFAFNDKNNCERIYNAILEHDADSYETPKYSPEYH